MAQGFITRRGGGGVGGESLRMIQVQSSSALPSVEQTGTVALVSSVAPKTLFVQQSAPTGTFDVGDVWVRTGVFGDIDMNIATKGAFRLSVLGAFQWTGSVWIRREAYMFNGVAWKAVGLILYKSGWMNEMLTGGWDTTQSPIVVYSDRIYLRGNSGYHCTICTARLIDVTYYQTMEVVGASAPIAGADSNTTGSVKIFANPTYAFGTATTIHSGTFVNNTVVSVDISSLTGLNYVGVSSYSGRQMYFKELRLLG